MKNFLLGLAVIVAAYAIPIGLVASQPEADAPTDPYANRYIGVDKCKKCHDAKSKGEQVVKWKETPHAKAFEILASDAAKKVGKEKGIEDPQKSDQCLKCHVTGHGEAAENFAKDFVATNGVQCESCHGPGEKHFKARMAAEDEEEGLAKIPDDEIVKSPDFKNCQKCHNEESPTYKPFCFKARFSKILHLDPRKKRTEAELKAMQCGCEAAGKECKCKTGECGGLKDSK